MFSSAPDSYNLSSLAGEKLHDVRGGGRGDQYVRLVVTVPTHLNHRQKELLQELKNTS